MKKLTRLIALVIVGLVLALGLVIPAQAQPQPQPQKTVKVLISFNRQPGYVEQQVVKGLGGQIGYAYDRIPVMAVTMPASAVQNLRKFAGVAAIEEDGVVHALAQTEPWGVDKIGANLVRPYDKGTGVKVAIIDTGIDLSHPDLLPVAGNVTFVSGTTTGNDDNGHGTHVAGIVAARDNSIGVVGVAPEASLYAVKVLNSNGSGSWSNVIAGINWAINNHMQVINMSLGGSPGTSAMQAACDTAYNSGIVVVAAAGNNYGGSVLYPAQYSSVIAVSATDSSNNIASFSNTGSKVELAAPGVNIYSTYYGDSYATLDGTSMASPHVAGVAALVIAANPTLSASQVRAQLDNTADHLGTAGRNNQYGYGLVDAYKAVPPSADTTPPYTSGWNPAKNATGVPVNTSIAVHVQDAGKGVDKNSIVMKVGVSPATPTPVTPVITGTPADYTLTYTPSPAFGNSQTVTVTVDAQDLASPPNVMTTDSYSFTTVAPPDSAPPYTSGWNPANGDTGVPVNTSITVHVRDDGAGVNQSTIKMTVAGSLVTPAITGTPADYTLTYTPSTLFGYNQVVNVTVDAKDLASPPNTMTTDSYSFTIVGPPDEHVPPYTSGWNPVGGATGVPINTNIVVHVKDDGAGVDISTIKMTVAGSPVTPAITGTSADYTLTYTPSTPFGYLQVVNVTVDAKDLALTPNTMPQDNYSFTTIADTTPPYTSGWNPAKNATGVPISTGIVVHVKDAGTGVDISTIAMTVAGSPVTPAITGAPADYTVTYTPSTPFGYLQVVNVTVDAKDLALTPNTMPQDNYSFTTTAAFVLHVKSVSMTLSKTLTGYTQAQVTITVVDAGGGLQGGVTVSGHWASPTWLNKGGTTNASGKVTLASGAIRYATSGTTFTYVIDNIVKTGYIYDSGSNVIYPPGLFTGGPSAYSIRVP